MGASQLYPFLTYELEGGVGGQHHAPATLPLGKRTGTYCTAVWLSLGAGLNMCRKSHPHQGLNLHPLNPQYVAIPAMLLQLPQLW